MRYEKPDLLEIGKARKAILGQKFGWALEWQGLPRYRNIITDHVDLDFDLQESEFKAVQFADEH